MMGDIFHLDIRVNISMKISVFQANLLFICLEWEQVTDVKEMNIALVWFLYFMVY